MHETFAREVATWHEFYMLVGTAAATLVGLLFIALTLNADLLHRDKFDASRALARQSFVCFLNLLTVAGVMLIPDQSHTGVGIPLVSIGGISLAFTVVSMVRRNQRARWRDIGKALRHTWLILIGMGTFFGIGIALWAGANGLLVWLTAAVLTLLSAASNNAWALLMRPRET